jgi:hypothetical protein
VGLYENSDMHAVRILAMEPTTDRQRGANTGRRFYNHATERLRILGEIPVRKFGAASTVAGKYQGPGGKLIKVAPLTDEDRFTIVRWIDLGCPIDLDYDSRQPETRHFGWMLDDNRPVLTLTTPQPGANASLDRIPIGMHDYYTGLAPESFTVTADFLINGIAPGGNLATKFKSILEGVWELKLAAPMQKVTSGKLIVSVQDRQGNTSRIERTFTVGPTMTRASR